MFLLQLGSTRISMMLLLMVTLALCNGASQADETLSVQDVRSAIMQISLPFVRARLGAETYLRNQSQALVDHIALIPEALNQTQQSLFRSVMAGSEVARATQGNVQRVAEEVSGVGSILTGLHDCPSNRFTVPDLHGNKAPFPEITGGVGSRVARHLGHHDQDGHDHSLHQRVERKRREGSHDAGEMEPKDMAARLAQETAAFRAPTGSTAHIRDSLLQRHGEGALVRLGDVLTVIERMARNMEAGRLRAQEGTFGRIMQVYSSLNTAQSLSASLKSSADTLARLSQAFHSKSQLPSIAALTAAIKESLKAVKCVA